MWIRKVRGTRQERAKRAVFVANNVAVKSAKSEPTVVEGRRAGKSREVAVEFELSLLYSSQFHVVEDFMKGVQREGLSHPR